MMIDAISGLGRGETVDRHHAQSADHRDNSYRQLVRPSSPHGWSHSLLSKEDRRGERGRRGSRETREGERSAVQFVGVVIQGAGSVPI